LALRFFQSFIKATVYADSLIDNDLKC